MQVTIRPCAASDIEVLEAVLPADQVGLHRERLQEHLRGECSYLVAWADSRPVGHVKVRWAGSVHRYVRHLFPAMPEIRRLVVDEEYRSKGVGGRLLWAAEELIAARGFAIAGLAVAVDNVPARTLYDHRGYVDWGRGTFASCWTRLVDGKEHEHRHVVTYMVKALAVRTASAA